MWGDVWVGLKVRFDVVVLLTLYRYRPIGLHLGFWGRFCLWIPVVKMEWFYVVNKLNRCPVFWVFVLFRQWYLLWKVMSGTTGLFLKRLSISCVSKFACWRLKQDLKRQQSIPGAYMTFNHKLNIYGTRLIEDWVNFFSQSGRLGELTNVLTQQEPQFISKISSERGNLYWSYDVLYKFYYFPKIYENILMVSGRCILVANRVCSLSLLIWDLNKWRLGGEERTSFGS